MAERPSPEAPEARPSADGGDDLAAALAEVLGMSWEARDAEVARDDAARVEDAAVAEWSPESTSEPSPPEPWRPEAALAAWSPEAVPEPVSPEMPSPTWTPETALSEWSPAAEASESSGSGEVWSPETALSEWSPEAAPEPVSPEIAPPDSRPFRWWGAWSPGADARPADAADSADAADDHPDPGPRRAGEPDESTAALEQAGLASPLSSALGVLGKVIPGRGAEPSPSSSPSARPEPEKTGGGWPSRRPEWLSVAALRDTWTTHRRDWGPGLVVGALIVVAFAVVLIAGGRDDDGSQVSTRPQPSVTAPDTTLEAPTTLPPDTTVALEEAPVDAAGAAPTASGAARSSPRARSTPPPTSARPRAASKPAARAPAPAPAPPAVAPEPSPPANDTDGGGSPPGDTDGGADPVPDPVPDLEPPDLEPPVPDPRCSGLSRQARIDCLKGLSP